MYQGPVNRGFIVQLTQAALKNQGHVRKCATLLVECKLHILQYLYVLNED